ncbi:MAG TPA: NmrA/HSCARG family protein [Euzebyales bacterium]
MSQLTPNTGRRMMAERSDRVVAVAGATGLQGGAVARRLLQEGWRVRALTRNPERRKVRSVAALGAEVVRADMDDPRSLDRALDGVSGVFSVQNHHISGYDGELAQGRHVTDAALRTGVRHVVYAAAGIGRPDTGVGSWDVKERIAAYMRDRRLPVTILRPMAFMELMTASKFFPAASTWHVMPEVMGAERPVGWLAVDDLAVIVANVFSDADRFVGADLVLAADVVSISGCRRLWREVMGRPPLRFPMPVWLFERFVGTDETTMWRWLRTHDIDLDTQSARELCPHALDVRAWLRRQRALRSHPPEAPRPAPDPA